MDAHCEMIMDEYREGKPVFDKMKDIIKNALINISDDNGMYVVTVEARVKTEKSLAGKLELKGQKYNSLADITDIIGARVVTFYDDDVDKVSVWIEKLFNIDWENSVDKRAALNLDQFGYMSVHFICQIPESMYKDPEHPEINQIKFEIQVRTALQHVWATAFHDTGYKSDFEIPREYRRRLNRLAGILEIADNEFKNIKNDIADYRRKIENIIRQGGGDALNLDLNADTWEIYIKQNPFERLNKRIAEINHAEIAQASMDVYLEVLESMGIKTLEDVENMKAEYSEDAYQLARYQLGQTDLDIVASTIGPLNLCLVKVIKGGYGEGGVKALLDKINGERPRNIRAAKRIIAVAESLNITA